MIEEGFHKQNINVSAFSIAGGASYTLKGSTLGSSGFTRLGINLTFSSGKFVKPKAPCRNCNITLKGTKGRG